MNFFFGGWDLTDWLIAFLVTAAWIAATVFLFIHPDPLNFATWATVSGTLVGVYHWLRVRDDKIKDSE